MLVSILATPVLFAANQPIIKSTYSIPSIQHVKSNAVAATLLRKGAQASVNINTVDAETLALELKGIGQKRAQAIIAYREQHGPFKSIDELANVKGISKRIVDQNRDKIII